MSRAARRRLPEVGEIEVQPLEPVERDPARLPEGIAAALQDFNSRVSHAGDDELGLRPERAEALATPEPSPIDTPPEMALREPGLRVPRAARPRLMTEEPSEDRHAAVAKALERYRADAPEPESAEIARDPVEREVGEKAAPDDESNEHRDPTERRLRIARRIGGITQALGGILGIVDARRNFGSDAGMGLTAAAAGFQGVGRGMAEGATHRLEENEARMLRERTRDDRLATERGQEKRTARDDELNLLREENLADEREADNARADATLAMNREQFDAGQEETSRHHRELEAYNAAMLAANDRRRHGGGGGGGGGGGHGGGAASPAAVAFTPEEIEQRVIDMTRLVPPERMEAARTAARNSLLAFNESFPHFKPAFATTQRAHLDELAGYTTTPTQSGSDLLAGANQARRLLPFEAQGWHLVNRNTRLSAQDLQAIPDKWNNTAVLISTIKQAASLARGLSSEDVMNAAAGRFEVGSPTALLRAKMEQIHRLYRTTANFGTPQAAELALLNEMFPMVGVRWSTVTGSNVALLLGQATALMQMGQQQMQAAGFERQ